MYTSTLSRFLGCETRYKAVRSSQGATMKRNSNLVVKECREAVARMPRAKVAISGGHALPYTNDTPKERKRHKIPPRGPECDEMTGWATLLGTPPIGAATRGSSKADRRILRFKAWEPSCFLLGGSGMRRPTRMGRRDERGQGHGSGRLLGRGSQPGRKPRKGAAQECPRRGSKHAPLAQGERR